MSKIFNKNLFFFLIFVIFLVVFTNKKAFTQKRAVKIDTLLTHYANKGLFSGTALVAYNNTIIYKKSFGDAIISWGIPNRTYSVFQIGSLSKMFTAAITMQMVDSGLIALDSAIIQYTDCIYNPNIAAKITIRQLLNHTSGLSNYTDETDFFSQWRFKNHVSAEKHIFDYKNLNLEFTPGTNYLYSNTNYIVLQAILEKILKKPYAEILKQQITDTLKLASLTTYLPQKIIDKMSVGYSQSMYDFEQAPYWNFYGIEAATGLCANVNDIYNFGNALFNKQFLSDSLLNIMIKDNKQPYGLGFMIDSVATRKNKKFKKTIGHYGATLGYNAAFIHVPEDDHTIILLDNIRDDANRNKLQPIVNSILNIIYNRPYTLPKANLGYYLANIAINQGLDKATSTYFMMSKQELSKYEPLTDEILIDLAYSFLRKNNNKNADRILKFAAAIFPRSYLVYHAFGVMYLSKNEYDRALKNFKNAISLNPKIFGKDISIYNKDNYLIKEIENQLAPEK